MTKKTATNALKVARKKTTKTTRVAKRFEKRSKNETRKEIFATRKAIALTKRQKRKTKKIANVIKKVAIATITKITIAKAKMTKNIEANKKTTYN